MAGEPVTPAARIDTADVQGIVLRGYGALAEARYWLLRFAKSSDLGGWLRGLVGRITSAKGTLGQTAINVGFTYPGLARFHALSPALPGFPPVFVEGMHGGRDDGTAHRNRILGDEGSGAPGSWRWGNTGSLPDAVLMLFATNASALRALEANEGGALSVAGIVNARSLEGVTLAGRKEHFGFRDGIAQPALRNGNPADDRPGVLALDREENTIAPGEILLGHRNAYDDLSEGPILSAAADPCGLLPPLEGAPGSLRHWGHDGSYLVFRQLQQHVATFWQSIAATAKALGEDPVWLAARLIGRWPSGAPVVLCPDADDPTLADHDAFGFAETDSRGFTCPLGSHIRRANPRDGSLSAEPELARTLANRHRLIRRARPYGVPLVDDLDARALLRAARWASDESSDRGLQFLCFNANLERQFELVQSAWLDNPRFAALRREVDPLVGARAAGRGAFSLQGSPLARRLTGLPRFVETRGGAYFFVPGLRALRWLAQHGST